MDVKWWWSSTRASHCWMKIKPAAQMAITQDSYSCVNAKEKRPFLANLVLWHTMWRVPTYMCLAPALILKSCLINLITIFKSLAVLLHEKKRMAKSSWQTTAYYFLVFLTEVPAGHHRLERMDSDFENKKKMQKNPSWCGIIPPPNNGLGKGPVCASLGRAPLSSLFKECLWATPLSCLLSSLPEEHLQAAALRSCTKEHLLLVLCTLTS